MAPIEQVLQDVALGLIVLEGVRRGALFAVDKLTGKPKAAAQMVADDIGAVEHIAEAALPAIQMVMHGPVTIHAAPAPDSATISPPATAPAGVIPPAPAQFVAPLPAVVVAVEAAK